MIYQCINYEVPVKMLCILLCNATCSMQPIYIDYFEDILLYLHLMPKKTEVANEPMQKIHKITVTRHHTPKQEIEEMKLI